MPTNKIRRIIFLACLICTVVAASSLAWVYITYTQIQQLQQPYPASKYLDLLQRLKNQGYSFVGPQQLSQYSFGSDYLIKPVNSSSKIAILVHDVDFDYKGASTLAEVERAFGVRSIFFVRVDADYFTQSISYFQSLEQKGWAIGIHYDSLSRSNGNQTLAINLFTAQLIYARTFFHVDYSRSHGDNYNLNVWNEWLYGNYTQTWSQLHLTDLTNIAGASYIADTNKVWSEPTQLKNIVLVNLHVDYW